MANNNNNQKVVPQAKQALNQMKLEIANELGMTNYQQMDKDRKSVVWERVSSPV